MNHKNELSIDEDVLPTKRLLVSKVNEKHVPTRVEQSKNSPNIPPLNNNPQLRKSNDRLNDNINKTIENLKKSLMRNSKVLLFITNFFESNEEDREFEVIHDFKFYKVKIGTKLVCECEGEKIECIHKKFIFNTFFHQDKIAHTINIDQMELLKYYHIELTNSHDCSMCYQTVIGTNKVFYFPKFESYTHKECFDNVITALTLKKSQTKDYQQYLKQMNYKVVDGNSLSCHEEDVPTEYSLNLNNKRKNSGTSNISNQIVNRDKNSKKNKSDLDS